MTNDTKAMYYKDVQVMDAEGNPTGEVETQQFGPFPATGNWPAQYQARGFRLVAEPGGQEGMKCPGEGCEELGLFTDRKDLAEHAMEVHGQLAYLGLHDGSVVFIADDEEENPEDLVRGILFPEEGPAVDLKEMLGRLPKAKLEELARQMDCYRSGQTNDWLVNALVDAYNARGQENGAAEAGSQGPAQ